MGLAFHNYHDVMGFMPYYGFDFATQPNPPFGTQGHGAFGLILPYLEQDNVAKLARLDRAVVDPVNLAPNYGTNPAGATQIKVYQCPSAPGRTVDYGPYLVSVGFPNAGSMFLGYTDYGIVRGIRSNLVPSCLPAGTTTGDTGFMGQKPSPGIGRPSGNKLTSITDGTSNTIIVAEDAGKQQVYARGIPVTPNGPGQVGWTLNAAWADYNTTIRVRGYDSTGTVRDGGCCVVNCNNVEQIYSFHTGGAQTLRGDGSVQFMKESVSPAVVAALVSYAGGEVFTND
jgi:hypothetical protein